MKPGKEDEKMANISVLRDSINGENKYARVVIQRKRTPICEKEISEIEKITDGLNVNLEILGQLGCIVADLGFPYFAGKIFTYIDMAQGKDFQFLNFDKQIKKPVDNPPADGGAEQSSL